MSLVLYTYQLDTPKKHIMRAQKNRRGPGGPCLNVPQKLVLGAFRHRIGLAQTTQTRSLTAARHALERPQLLFQRRSSLRDQLAPQLKPGRVFPVPLAVIQVRHDSAGILGGILEDQGFIGSATTAPQTVEL